MRAGGEAVKLATEVVADELDEGAEPTETKRED